ncbi:MAG: ABC transporter substrate-binding protein [Planctomycetota bacterium]|nr:ABC transporter substrate-binding protein [Planctomycetota bacterium]
MTVLLLNCQKTSHANFPTANWRIITIGPSTAANLYSLGLSDNIVAVSEWCSVPQFDELPRIGALGSPSLERIAELQPNVVLVQGRQDQLEQYCLQNQVFFHSFNTDTIQGWREEMSWLGSTFGLQQSAESIVDDFEEQLSQLNPGSKKATALLVLSRRAGAVSDLLVAAQGSFLSELLESVGGINVIRDQQDYIYLQEELLLELNPDLILELQQPNLNEDILKVWRNNFATVNAVRDGAVVNIFTPQSLMPGPEMLRTAQDISKLIQQMPVQ